MEKSIHSEPYRRIVARLRERRENLGLTQQELASRLNVTQSFVSKLERGERRIDVLELLALSKALAFSIDEILINLQEP
jgi:transcriptional regulator with XRE-family HTH domain